MHTITGAVKAATHDASRRDGNHAGYFPATPKSFVIMGNAVRHGAGTARSGQLYRQAEALGQQAGPLPVLGAERALGAGEADVVQ